MIHSMTAFGRNQSDSDWGTLVWELRSVNHRYLDISLRLAEDLRALEAEVRKRLGRTLQRGKVDCSLRLQRDVRTAAEFHIDGNIMTGLSHVAETVRRQLPDASYMTVTDILQWPGVLKAPTIDIDALGAAALSGFDQALAELQQTRSREGAGLADHIEQRLAAADKIVSDTRALIPELTEVYRQRVRERLAEIEQALDPARLEQEIVIFASKTDIAEELDRLATHISEVRRILGKGGAVGRRLDFLMQEFNREANTIGSKAVDIRVTNASVELKVLIEQMREQVQNIE